MATPDEVRKRLERLQQQSQEAATPEPEPALSAAVLQRLMGQFDPTTGMPLPQSPQETEAQLGAMSETATPIAKGALPIAIGTAGSALGAAAGAASPIPGGALMGEAAGGYGARKLNQALGLEGEGMAGDILSAAGPLAARIPLAAVRGASRFLGRHAPGAAGALHQEAAQQAAKLPEFIDIPVPSDLLFRQVSSAGLGAAPIPASRLAKEAERIIERQMARGAGAEIPGLRTIAEGILGDLQTSGGTLDLVQVAEKLKAYGKLSGVIQDRTGEATGYGKALFRALNQDLDDAISQGSQASTDIEALKRARSIFRREAARYDLSDIIAKSISSPDPELAEVGGIATKAMQTRTDMATHIDPRKIEDFVKRNDFFRESLTRPELEEIEATLKSIRALPKLPTPKGVNAGSMRMAQIGGAGGALGAAIGSLYGSPGTGMAIGTGASLASNWMISQALMTPTGRKLLLRVIQPGPIIPPAGMALLIGGLSTEARQALGQ